MPVGGRIGTVVLTPESTDTEITMVGSQSKKDELKRRMVERWPDAIPDITGIGHDYLTGKHGPCPKCVGMDRWRSLDDFDQNGGAICNQCGPDKTNHVMTDGFAVIMWFLGCDFSEAVKLVAKWLEKQGGPSYSTPKVKPKQKQRPTKEFPTEEAAIAHARWLVSKDKACGNVGEPVKVYEFGPDDRGRIELEARFEFDEAGKHLKETRPVSKHGDKWRVKALESPRPLYRLSRLKQELTDAPDALVVVCEGPKATDAAMELGYTATTSPGGSSNARNADWSPLAGRNVVILPDADKPGEKYARQVAGVLSELSTPASVKIVDLPGQQPTDDLVEWLNAGGDREQLDRLIENAPTWQPDEKAEESEPVCNYRMEQDQKGKTYHIPKPIREILCEVRECTDEWPRASSDMLFIVEDGKVHYLGGCQAFFGFLQTACGHVFWQDNGPGYIKRQEFYEEFLRTATAYHAVEELPHEPPIQNHFYVCKEIKPGDGSHLAKLVGYFSPATAVDRELIRALFVTPLWGGDAGLRPMFMVTASGGRGRGKSKLCQAVATLYGGAIDILPSEKMEAIKTRLLSPSAMSKRICLIDNVKTTRFSWGELEGLVDG